MRPAAVLMPERDPVLTTQAPGKPDDRTVERWVERRITVIWALLFFNGLGSARGRSLIPIPRGIAQMLTFLALAPLTLDLGTPALAGIPFHLEPITQANLFWRHTWPNVTQTSAWLGMAEGHSEAVLVFPQNPRVDTVLTFGAEIHVPLNDWMAIYGSANFITPAATGTVDAFLGVTFYPGGGARHAHRNRFAPLLPVSRTLSGVRRPWCTRRRSAARRRRVSSLPVARSRAE